jgi:hypothetical protein
MTYARAALAAMLVLAACGPIPRDRAEEQCFERARLALKPKAEIRVGATTANGGEPYLGGSLEVSSDYLYGKDPSAVYDACVYQKSGQPPSRPLYDRPDWKE